MNLTATLIIGSGVIQFSWTPSNGGQIGSFLDYVVLIEDGNGAVAYNDTVKNSQLIINTLDPCGQYYATVAPVCQGTVSVASLGGLIISGGTVQNSVHVCMCVWGGGQGRRRRRKDMHKEFRMHALCFLWCMNKSYNCAIIMSHLTAISKSNNISYYSYACAS